MAETPPTLLQAIQHFADPDVCLEFVRDLRWPNGVACPTCGSVDVGFIASRRMWQCKSKHPKKQFSVKVGTIMEDSPISLSKWLPAIWLIASAKNGISSYELGRALGVSQKSAWFMLHRIRFAMHDGSGAGMLTGTVEADETYIGGKARNMHAGKRAATIKGRGGVGKVAVMGLLERHGPDGHSAVRAKVIANTKRGTLTREVRENVDAGATVYTDGLRSYDGLGAEYMHEAVNHDASEYVRGTIHTNGIENFWSLLKRGIKGTYVSVEPFHLFRYLDEQAYRFNTRERDDSDRFAALVARVAGRRLTYDALTGDAGAS